MNWTKETSVPGSEIMLYLSFWIKEGLSMNQLNKPWQYNARFSTLTYTYKAIKHLNNIMLNLQLLLREFFTLVIWGKMVEGD